MEQRFGKRGRDALPSPVNAPRAEKKRSNVRLITLAIIGFGVIGWVAKQVLPEQPTAPAKVTTTTTVASEATTTFPAASVGKMWVISDRLARRTCPSASCGIVGQHFFREAADVVEIQGDWARISKRYDASCVGGKSQYVDEGNAVCTADNGIVDGQFAEWVEAKYLSPTRPADPAEGATGLSKLLGGSDDFRTYEQAFVRLLRISSRVGNAPRLISRT